MIRETSNRAIREDLRLIDPTRSLRCVWDDRVRRWAFVTFRPGVEWKHADLHRLVAQRKVTLWFHVADDSEVPPLDGKGFDRLIEECPEARQALESGRWTECPLCGCLVHGPAREPTSRDVKRLRREAIRYYPGGLEAWLRDFNRLTDEGTLQQEKQYSEILAPYVDQVGWAIAKAKFQNEIGVRTDWTREDRIREEALAEAKEEDRLRGMRLA